MRTPHENSTNRPRAGLSGMTLVEVLIALGLFIIGFLGIFALGGQLKQVNSYTAAMSEASLLAETKIEEMSNRPANQITSGAESSGDYAMIWKATNITDDTIAVYLTVNWSDTEGKAHRMTMNSIFTEPQ